MYTYRQVAGIVQLCKLRVMSIVVRFSLCLKESRSTSKRATLLLSEKSLRFIASEPCGLESFLSLACPGNVVLRVRREARKNHSDGTAGWQKLAVTQHIHPA